MSVGGWLYYHLLPILKYIDIMIIHQNTNTFIYEIATKSHVIDTIKVLFMKSYREYSIRNFLVFGRNRRRAVTAKQEFSPLLRPLSLRLNSWQILRLVLASIQRASYFRYGSRTGKNSIAGHPCFRLAGYRQFL